MAIKAPHACSRFCKFASSNVSTTATGFAVALRAAVVCARPACVSCVTHGAWQHVCVCFSVREIPLLWGVSCPQTGRDQRLSCAGLLAVARILFSLCLLGENKDRHRTIWVEHLCMYAAALHALVNCSHPTETSGGQPEPKRLCASLQRRLFHRYILAVKRVQVSNTLPLLTLSSSNDRVPAHVQPSSQQPFVAPNTASPPPPPPSHAQQKRTQPRSRRLRLA